MTVLPVATRALVEACARLGLDEGALLARAGVDRALLEDPDARLPAELADAVWREASLATADPALPLHAAEQTPFGAFRVLDYLGATGATVGEGGRRIAEYFPLVDPRGVLAVEEEAAAVALTFRATEGDLPPPAQEYTLAILVSRARHVSAAPASLRVQFTFPRPADPREHARVLGVEPEFGAGRAAVVLARATWEGPTRTADRTLFSALADHARSLLRGAGGDELIDGVRGAIAAELPGREPSLSRVARRLGTSPRTLQRRLSGRGASFAAVVDGVRRERAEGYLRQPDVSVAEVSWLLGFAEQSAFTRAFRRWTGAPPTEWRRGLRGAEGSTRRPR
ncbi:MAG TPA: AraC family transcriptional regulator ligand-binding domain-containing protein [Anaeromyxobacter sp.]